MVGKSGSSRFISFLKVPTLLTWPDKWHNVLISLLISVDDGFLQAPQAVSFISVYPFISKYSYKYVCQVQHIHSTGTICLKIWRSMIRQVSTRQLAGDDVSSSNVLFASVVPLSQHCQKVHLNWERHLRLYHVYAAQTWRYSYPVISMALCIIRTPCQYLQTYLFGCCKSLLLASNRTRVGH